MSTFIFALALLSCCVLLRDVSATDDLIGKLVDSAQKMVVESINRSLMHDLQGVHKIVARSVNPTPAQNASSSNETATDSNSTVVEPRSAAGDANATVLSGNATTLSADNATAPMNGSAAADGGPAVPNARSASEGGNGTAPDAGDLVPRSSSGNDTVAVPLNANSTLDVMSDNSTAATLPPPA